MGMQIPTMKRCGHSRGLLRYLTKTITTMMSLHACTQVQTSANGSTRNSAPRNDSNRTTNSSYIYYLSDSEYVYCFLSTLPRKRCYILEYTVLKVRVCFVMISL